MNAFRSFRARTTPAHPVRVPIEHRPPAAPATSAQEDFGWTRILARFQLNLGRHAEVVCLLGPLRRQRPDDLETMVLLARAYTGLESCLTARILLEHVLDRDPHHEAAQRSLTELIALENRVAARPSRHNAPALLADTDCLAFAA